ncbi:IS3 family transposase [Nonomuraea turcica]|uniref:IS3 family transposase n=1 Tax=Nonomuraea sp. G32 TaxID=3067274 RepID=UPI00273CB294|nr:IS3 family transposase [Nonomuraea sp. G32]MDP4511668.1 IS3 family transposase [Nonomuraea sp. G32]
MSKSGYYDWEKRPMSATEQRREDLKPLVGFVFAESGRIYGHRRAHAELRRVGVEVDDELVRKLMRQMGLVPVQLKPRRGLTIAEKTAAPVRVCGVVAGIGGGHGIAMGTFGGR